MPACICFSLSLKHASVPIKADFLLRTSLSTVCNGLADALVFFLQAQSLPNAVSKRAGSDSLLDRGLFGSSEVFLRTSLGIPAVHGARSIAYAPSGANSPPDASDGFNAENATEEVVPESTEGQPESEVTVIIQQLLKMVEAAASPAQGTHIHLTSLGVSVNRCMLPGNQGAELAILIIDALLVSVDVFQEEGKFPAAIDLMAKVGYASVHCQPAHACKCYVGWFGIRFGKLSSVAHAGTRLCWLTII